jgi:hypothetical protein
MIAASRTVLRNMSRDDNTTQNNGTCTEKHDFVGSMSRDVGKKKGDGKGLRRMT